MTGLPTPPRKKRTKKAKRKAKPKPKNDYMQEALDVQDEVVTADEVLAENCEPLPTDRLTQQEKDYVQSGHAPEIIERKLTNRVFACLWKGEDLPGFSNDLYDLRYVDCLVNGIRRHVPNGELTLVCDDIYYDRVKADPRFEHLRLEKLHGHGIGGWTNILEVCREGLRPKLGKRHVLVGLDTIFVGDCQWIFDWDEHPVGLPLDPIHPHLPCDAVWSFNYEGAAFVWDAYEAAKADGMKDYLLFGRPSEMQLLRYLYKCEKWTPFELAPHRLLSFKCHVAKRNPPIRKDTSIVFFHGVPKPHQLPDASRIKREWLRP